MTHTTAPTWLRIVGFVFAVLAFAVSSSLFLAPEQVLENTDLKANGVHYLIQMWAARQFALGCTFAFASMKKQTPLISLAFVFFLVMNIADFLIGISQKDNGLIIGSLVMCVIAGIILLLANKERTKPTGT